VKAYVFYAAVFVASLALWASECDASSRCEAQGGVYRGDWGRVMSWHCYSTDGRRLDL
jgi:hypothetical protein